MNKKTLALLNLLTVITLIIWNYLTNFLEINGNTVASVSSEYNNLFTPAGYAFSIWGLIYLGLLAHGIFQFKKAFIDRRDDDFILKMGPWFIIANLATAAWLWFWLSDQTGVSVLMMFLILLSLIIIVIRLNMERWDAPLPVIFWIWWPFCLFSGWIAIATVANVAAYLTKIGWQALFSELTWTLIMIIVATLINLFMIISRNMREFALVGVWALIAISVRHWGKIPELQWTALVCAIVLFIAISIHGYLNIDTNPVRKIKEMKCRDPASSAG